MMYAQSDQDGAYVAVLELHRSPAAPVKLPHQRFGVLGLVVALAVEFQRQHREIRSDAGLHFHPRPVIAASHVIRSPEWMLPSIDRRPAVVTERESVLGQLPRRPMRRSQIDQIA